MRRLTALLLSLLLLAAAADSTAIPVGKPIPRKATPPLAVADSPAVRHLREAQEAINADDAKATEAALRAAFAAEGFEALDPGWRADLYAAAAQLAAERADPTQAHQDLRRATGLPGATFDAWVMRARVAAWLDAYDDIARSLEQVVRRWPERARELDVSLLGLAIFGGEPGRPAAGDLLEALLAADYRTPVTGETSEYWLDLALRRADAGDVEGARAVLGRVDDPFVLARAAADRRLDAAFDAPPTGEQLMAMARRHEADLRARALLDPDRTEILASLARSMMVLGAHEAVIALADQAEAQLAAAPESFVDEDEHMAWVIDSAARAERRMGRIDAAIARFRRASDQLELGQDNTSQVLNLANLLAEAGRTREATAEIARVGRMSGYGRMVLVSVQHIVAVQEGDADAEKVAMAYLAEHSADNASAYFDALLRTGRSDEAADHLVGRLDDPARRADALLDLQRFREGAPLPVDTLRRERLDALLAREDVAAAIARHGRVLEWPLYRPY